MEKFSLLCPIIPCQFHWSCDSAWLIRSSCRAGTTRFREETDDEKVFALRFSRSRSPGRFSQPSEVDGARQEPGAGVPPGCVLLPPDFLSHVHVPDGWHDGGRWLHSARGELQITAIRSPSPSDSTPDCTLEGFDPADNMRNLVPPPRRPY